MLAPDAMLASMEAESNRPFDTAPTVEDSSRSHDRVRPLRIAAHRATQIVEHLSRARPNEGCGLLAAVSGPEADHAVHFFPGTNIDASPRRFTMDPREVIDAMWWMRTQGWHLAAIVHSHPSSPPTPSRTDLREWYYPAARALIVSFAEDRPQIGCWTLVADRGSPRIVESPLQIIER